MINRSSAHSVAWSSSGKTQRSEISRIEASMPAQTGDFGSRPVRITILLIPIRLRNKSANSRALAVVIDATRRKSKIRMGGSQFNNAHILVVIGQDLLVPRQSAAA